ncbi:glycoside hydrolase family 11 protein [Sorangium sp. So ce426]|uniref:glycoside hydrolase family 11 protein n=1 Tax=Sorangium sp. So ce426 TaxID=3133312 RepID=UPI003F5B51EF
MACGLLACNAERIVGEDLEVLDPSSSSGSISSTSSSSGTGGGGAGGTGGGSSSSSSSGTGGDGAGGASSSSSSSGPGGGGAGAGGASSSTSSLGTGGGGAGGAGGAPDACTTSEPSVCSNQTGDHCGFTYQLWKDRGTGCLTSTADGFSVEWSDINSLLGCKGLRPGSANQIVTYEADFQPGGNSYLGVYGWTKKPDVEYYIVDGWGTWRPPGGTRTMGTVTSDGGVYDIYRVDRSDVIGIDGVNAPPQFWSVRTQKRTSGTITVANHFDAWQSLGMNMGTLSEVSMFVEGYQSSGRAEVSFSMR